MLTRTISLCVLVAGASPMDPPEISGPVKIVILGVGGLLLAGISVLTFAKLWMDVMGKRSSATVSIQAHSETDNKEKDGAGSKGVTFDITGFVAAKDFEQHKEDMRLRATGLEKQISDARHDFTDQIGRLIANGLARETLNDEWRGEIAGDVKATSLKLAGVEAQSNLILGIVQNLDAKVDRNNENRRRLVD